MKIADATHPEGRQPVKVHSFNLKNEPSPCVRRLKNGSLPDRRGDRSGAIGEWSMRIEQFVSFAAANRVTSQLGQ